jgi:hypothetical protein
MNMMTAEELIQRLGLKPLPGEGGFYCETYRSVEEIPKEALAERYTASKPVGTAIYYLLTPDTFSRLHRLPTDEIFHFYVGDPVMMLQLHPSGKTERVVLGPDLRRAQRVQVVVPRGTWQGSLLLENGRYALMGATMAPGFDFDDFEAGTREDLTREYPKEAELVRRLTADEA